jgi:hypothetical protein
MNKCSGAIAFLVVFWLAQVGAHAADPAVEARALKEGQEVADAWLKQVDQGQYAEAWEESAKDFKRNVSKRKWLTAVGEMRKPLGKLVSRKQKSAKYTKELTGAPEGEYVILEFDGAFEKRPAAVETVTLFLGVDLRWRVAGYKVK